MSDFVVSPRPPLKSGVCMCACVSGDDGENFVPYGHFACLVSVGAAPASLGPQRPRGGAAMCVTRNT